MILLIQKFPHDWHGRFMLGKSLHSLKRLDEAIVQYRRALESNPELAAAHSFWAVALQSQGRLDDAVRHYRESVRLNPKHPIGHYKLAGALRAQGKVAGAHQEYCGPMAKPQRVFVMTITALLCGLLPSVWQAIGFGLLRSIISCWP